MQFISTYAQVISTYASENNISVDKALNKINAMTKKFLKKKFDFSGTWDTNWGKLVLSQKKNKVKGKYEYKSPQGVIEGEIEGSVTINILEFNWEESTGMSGVGYFVMHNDEKNFSGKSKLDDSHHGIGHGLVKKHNALEKSPHNIDDLSFVSEGFLIKFLIITSYTTETNNYFED